MLDDLKGMRTVLAAYYWVRALRSSSLEDYEIAWSYLEKCEKYYIKDFEFYLLKGFLCLALYKPSECIRFCSKAIELIASSNKINEDEKNYLYSYAVYLTEKAFEISNISGQMPDELTKNLKVYNLNNVRKAYKSNFPYRRA